MNHTAVMLSISRDVLENLQYPDEFFAKIINDICHQMSSATPDILYELHMWSKDGYMHFRLEERGA